MADTADKASDWETREREASLQAIRRAAAAIPPGKPGDCETCGNYSPRLVGGICAPCRDFLAMTKG